MKLLYSFVTCLAITVSSAFAAPHIDYDADGVEDYLSVSIGTDQVLSWIFRASTTGATAALSPLGKQGDQLAPGLWRASRGTERVLLSRDASANTIWTIEGAETFTFGTGAGSALSGADVDHSGLLDAIYVSKRDGKLVWNVRLDPFASSPAGGTALPEIEFGTDQDVPFFADPLGGGDWLAVLSSTTGIVSLRNPVTGEDRQVTVGTQLAGLGRPVPVAQADGTDLLVFTERSAATTVVKAVRMDGVLAARNRLANSGTVVVGDFSRDYAGDEVAIQGTRNFKGYNPSSKKRINARFLSDIPIDSINIHEFGGVSADPGFQSCAAFEPRDGGKHGFTWKPNSDTTYYAVAVLPGSLAGKVKKVEVFSTTGTFVKQLTFFGCGNPDSNGIRCNHKDFALTGKDYNRIYGSIVLKVFLKNNTCGSYLLDNPSKRID